MTMLVHEIPEDTKPVQKTGIGIQGGSVVIVNKIEPFGKINRIQVFYPNKGGKTPDAEMKKSGNIRQVGNGNSMLWKKLTGYRRVIVWFVSGIVPGIEPGG